MANHVRIEEWIVTKGGDEFTAPEMRPRVLNGVVFGHPNFPDGSRINTSQIVSFEGRVVTCGNRTYELGQCGLSQLELMRQTGIEFEELEPLSFLNRW